MTPFLLAPPVDGLSCFFERMPSLKWLAPSANRWYRPLIHEKTLRTRRGGTG